MAHHKSSLKRIKTNLVRQERNRARKSQLGSLIKKIQSVPAGEKIPESGMTLIALADNSARKGIIHKNKAARIKSMVQRKLVAAKA